MLLEILVSLVVLVLGIWVVNRVFPTKVSSPAPPASDILLQKQVNEMAKHGEIHMYPQSAKCGVSKC